MNNSEIDVAAIVPEAKDTGRAARLSLVKGVWKDYPSVGAASKMAQAIDDPYKLVRRAKAVVQRYGTTSSAWRYFADRLWALGFTHEQVKIIAHSK